MKKCDLCQRRPASMYCDSDQASLCFQCDANVHAANFLVARHTRTLLCHACHSHTPWTASGLNLGSAISFCRRCCPAGSKVGDQSSHRGDDGEDGDVEEDGYEDGDEEEEEEEEGADEEDGDNQVVPWSGLASSNSEGGSFQHCSSENSTRSSAKRCRDIEEVKIHNDKSFLFLSPPCFTPVIKFHDLR